MALLEWKEEYSLGDAGIDEEHKNLFDIANKIFEIGDPKNNVNEIRTLIHQLYDYMKYHFAHEENLMQNAKFPEIVLHKIKHQEIIKEMNQLMGSSKQIVQFSERLSGIMVKWVLKHILEEDIKIKQHAENIA